MGYDAGVGKGPQLNSLCLSSSKNLTGQAEVSPPQRSADKKLGSQGRT